MNAKSQERLLVSAKETQKILSIGNTKFYELVKQHKLEVIKFGKMTRVTLKSVRALAQSEAE